MFSNKYFNKFKSLCDMVVDDDSSSTMQVDELRRIIMYRSTGLCPGTLIVSEDNGSFLSVKQMCNEQTYAFVKQKGLFEVQDIEVYALKARQTEAKMIVNSKCAIGNKRQLLEELAEKHRDDCKAFRKSLFDNKFDIVAIHVCRWDGSPRKSISEIRDAICLYPSSVSKMKQFVRNFLILMLAWTGYRAVKYTILKKREKQVFDQHQRQDNDWHFFNAKGPYRSEFERSLGNKESPRNFNAGVWESIGTARARLGLPDVLPFNKPEKKKIIRGDDWAGV